MAVYMFWNIEAGCFRLNNALGILGLLGLPNVSCISDNILSIGLNILGH